MAQVEETAREEVQYDRFSDEQKPAFWGKRKTAEAVVDKSPGKREVMRERKESRRVGESRKVPDGDRRKRRRGRSKVDPNSAEVQALEEEIDAHRWGAENTRRAADTNRRIWEDAMDEMEVDENEWYEYEEVGVRNFGKFVTWFLVQKNISYKEIKVWPTFLNNVRAREKGDTTRPWKKNKEIKDLVNLYRSKKEAQDKLLRKEAVEGKRELPKRMKNVEKRVCWEGNEMNKMMTVAEKELGEGKYEKVGTVATCLLQILFAVRASTMGGIEDPTEDVRVGEDGLSFTIRFIKGWKPGKQETTGLELPIDREVRRGNGVPWGDSEDSPRSRALRIIRAAVEHSTLVFWESKEEASGKITSRIKKMGMRKATAGSTKVVTSHSGRKAAVSTMRYGGESVEGVTKRGLGLSKKVVQEWMLVSTEKVVDKYHDRRYQPDEFMMSLMEFMRGRKV